jgi:hypothetical protein
MLGFLKGGVFLLPLIGLLGDREWEASPAVGAAAVRLSRRANARLMGCGYLGCLLRMQVSSSTGS